MILNSKEISSILISTLILGVIISLIESLQTLLYTFLTILIIILINVFAKKIVSFYLDSEIEINLWEIKRYGFKPSRYFKKPFIAGAFLPIIVTALSLGYLKWMACLIFNVKAKIYKTTKRHALYSFSEMTENHIGLIASAGIFANLCFAILGYLIGFPEFSKLSIYYSFYNLIPISNLDGNKIFFGNLILWSFLSALTLIGLAYVFLVI